jgi:anti-sigma regulatory factor (Ser/Thr protein kinase)
MPQGLPSSFEFLVPTDLAYVRPARKMIEALLAAQGWEEDVIDDVGLLATEVVQNAIEHGSLGDGQERIRIGCMLEDMAVTLDVRDPGTGKDPSVALLRDATVPPPLDAARGRGLFLIHRLATQFDRELLPERGLKIVVRRIVDGA